MAKRKRHQKTRIIQYKPKAFYPMAYCTKEEIPIAVSHTKCKKKIKVNWIHFREDIAEFRKGYEFDMKECKKGDTVYCPVCGANLDFRLWMSDSRPHIVEFKKGDKDDELLQEKEK